MYKCKKKRNFTIQSMLHVRTNLSDRQDVELEMSNSNKTLNDATDFSASQDTSLHDVANTELNVSCLSLNGREMLARK